MRIAAAADEAQHAHRHAEHHDALDVEREDADGFAALEGDQDAQRLSGAVDLPPLVLEEPGIEDASGLGARVQAVPIRRETRELLVRGEELDGELAARGRGTGRERGPRCEARKLRCAVVLHGETGSRK